MNVKSIMLKAGVVGTTALLTYTLVARHRQLRWGARDDEVHGTLPGDEFIESPRYQTTRAITTNAPASEVWPWLVQMGQGRGGFYSYDWLKNLMGLDIHSADAIIPELQDLKVGDKVRLTPGDYSTRIFVMDVAILELERSLVLRAPGTPEEALEAGLPYATWAFILEPISEVETRLIVRFRSDFKPTLRGLVFNKYALAVPHLLIAEQSSNTPSPLMGLMHDIF
jgi:hypothetical protein